MAYEEFNMAKYDILFGRMKEISNEYFNSSDISSDEYARSLGEYCSILKVIVGDADLARVLAHLKECAHNEQTMAHAQKIIDETDSFYEYLVIEDRLLKAVGIPHALRDELIVQHELMRPAVRLNLSKVREAPTWLKELDGLRSLICDAHEESIPMRRWLKAKKKLYYFGGWALIGADGGAVFGRLFPDFPLPFAIVSAAYGRTLIEVYKPT